MFDKTMTFSFPGDREEDIKNILTTIYGVLKERGYSPIDQAIEYILSENPTYITTYNSAHSLTHRTNHDKLLQVLLKSYLGE